MTKSRPATSGLTSDLEHIADYINCVPEGQILFCSPRDEILERWGVVKLDEEALRGEIQPLLRGVRHGAYGCQALTNDIEAARAVLPSEAVIEKASLEDIVVLLQAEER